MVDKTKSKLNLVFYSSSTSLKIYLGEKSAIIDIDLFLSLKCQSFKGSCSFIVMFSGCFTSL